MATSRFRYRFRQATAILRRGPVLFFLAWITLWICFYQHPFIIYARGYGNTLLFEPLTQIDDVDSEAFWTGWDFSPAGWHQPSWDGETLLIDYPASMTPVPPSNPAGDVVIAALPHGIGFGKQEQNSSIFGGIADTAEPWVIPYFLIAVLPFVFAALRWIWRDFKKRPGHCHHCHYNLTGNTTGICPECGTPIEPQTPPPLQQGD